MAAPVLDRRKRIACLKLEIIFGLAISVKLTA